MKIVKRFALGESAQTISALTQNEIKALVKTGDTQQSLLNSLYGNWLVCNCQIPITVKHFKDTNYFFLSRIVGRGEHLPNCKLLALLDNGIDSQKAIASKEGTSFSFSVTSSNTAGQTSQSIRTNSSFSLHQKDKLYSLVAALLTDANVNKFKYGKALSFTDEQQKVIASARRFSLGGKSLHQYLFFGLKNLKLAINTLEKSAYTWLGNNNPQAIILAHINKLDETDTTYEIEVKEGWLHTIHKPIKISRINGSFNANKGPLLLTLVISKTKSKTAPYGITRGFVAPCLNSNSFVILDSELERTFAKICIATLIKTQSNVIVEKPLLAKFHDGVPILPDFIFHNGDIQTVVEVMGKWTDDEYRTRKMGIIKILRTLYSNVIFAGKYTAADHNLFYRECSLLIDEILSK